MKKTVISIRYLFLCMMTVAAGHLFLLAGGNSFAQIPDWYLEGRSMHYPADLYIVGMGEGDTLEEAAGQARTSLGAQIRVRVESEITSIVTEMDRGDRSSFESMYRNESTSRIDEQLPGVEIAMQGEHAGRYYALAALDRQRYVRELHSELDRLRESYDAMVESGRNHIRQGQITTGINALLEAQGQASEFYSALSTHNALAHRSYGSGDILGVARLVPEIRETLASVRLSVKSGDEQAGVPGRQLAEPIVFSAVYKQNGREVPVSSLPLLVAYQDGGEADRVTTDAEGLASVHLTAMRIRGEMNRITATASFSEIPPVFRSMVRDISVRANYRISDTDRIPVAVVVTDEAGRRHAGSEQRLGSVVERLGYRLSDASGVVLEGSLGRVDSREVDGLDGRQFVVRSEMNLMIRQRSDNSVVGSLEARGTGMSHRSESDALNASLNRLSIDRQDLARALAGVTMEMAMAEHGSPPSAVREQRDRHEAPAGTGRESGGRLPKTTIDDFTFEVHSASMTPDNRVIVEVMITNHDHRDRNTRFSRRLFIMYDQEGREVTGPAISVASSSTVRGWGFDHLIIPDVPVKMTIEFRDVHPETNVITLLSFRAGSTDVRLRDIPLIKSSR
ncbi:LPP20 family lipoprotein [Balneolales bacterium ANBcel1]|nr:LPP20 family lipoprotein [Balneolales bacterium ANBcel1]